jgi:hypothetical protein
VLCGANEAVRGLLEILHSDPGVGREDASGEQPQVGVIAGVVLIHQRTEPAVVAFGHCFPGLLRNELGLRRRHLREASQDEIQLDRHRLLAPQGAIVVEHRHPFLRGHGS